MKLKKIASLALAGIMAVSMLAGCKGGESSSSDSNSTTVVTATDSADAAAVLNDSRNDYAKNVAGVTYKESASLEEILKSIVTDKYGKDSNALENLTKNSGSNFAPAAFDDTMFNSKLSDKVVGGIDAWNTVSTNFAKAGTYKYARVYYVGGGYTAKEAANSVTTNVRDLENTTWMPVDAASSTLHADYSAEVAAVKMTSNANTDQSVWFIAVVYTQVIA